MKYTITDDMIERAAECLYYLKYNDSWEELVETGRVDDGAGRLAKIDLNYWRETAKAALEAALGGGE